MEAVPADVVIARAVRAHTRALVAMAAAVVVLAGMALAALSLAGQNSSTPPIAAGLTLLFVGQAGALVAAGCAIAGLLRVLRDADPAGAGVPGRAAARGRAAAAGHAADRPAPPAPQAVVRQTARAFALLMRIIAGGCVLAVTVWAIANMDGIAGAVVGAVVAVQVIVVLAVLRVHLLRSL